MRVTSTLAVGMLPSVMATNMSAPCAPSSFSTLSLPSISVTNITASLTSNYSLPASADLSPNHYPEDVINLNVCEVNITYTHPGQNDSINVFVWLPTNWNGRFMGLGGGGWDTGSLIALPWPASKGYVAATTDGGHALGVSNAWALKSKGNVDWSLLQDFASIALDDTATIAKAVTKRAYGLAPKKSYFSGCSTGGRQAHMLASRYPEQYDGILAAAPAINWDRLLTALYHPQKLMDWAGIYPPLCELDGYTAAAVAACDELDGVKDGIVNNPWTCKFDPESVIGKTYNCSTGPSGKLTASGAKMVKQFISHVTFSDGSLYNGRPLDYGHTFTASFFAVANTTCTAPTDGSEPVCKGNPFAIAGEWVKLYVLKDADANLTALKPREWDSVYRQSINQYAGIIDTSDPDLTDFKEAGGKLLSWHGLGDAAIPTNNTIEYWERVKEKDTKVDDYYRLFMAPGVGHCSYTLGLGWYPGSGIDALVKWVEEGAAPDRLEAHVVGQEKARSIELCKWPDKVVFKGGDGDKAESWGCEA